MLILDKITLEDLINGGNRFLILFIKYFLMLIYDG